MSIHKEYVKELVKNAGIEVIDDIHLRKEIFWSTGIGVIDSAITIYNESISNGNIKEIK